MSTPRYDSTGHIINTTTRRSITRHDDNSDALRNYDALSSRSQAGAPITTIVLPITSTSGVIPPFSPVNDPGLLHNSTRTNPTSRGTPPFTSVNAVVRPSSAVSNQDGHHDRHARRVAWGLEAEDVNQSSVAALSPHSRQYGVQPYQTSSNANYTATAWTSAGANLVNGDGVRLKPLDVSVSPSKASTISGGGGGGGARVRPSSATSNASVGAAVASPATSRGQANVHSARLAQNAQGLQSILQNRGGSPLQYTSMSGQDYAESNYISSSAAVPNAASRSHTSGPAGSQLSWGPAIPREDEVDTLLSRVQYLEDQVNRLTKALRSAKMESDGLRVELAQAQAQTQEALELSRRNELRAMDAETRCKLATEQLRAPPQPVPQIQTPPQRRSVTDSSAPSVPLEGSQQALALSFVSALSRCSPATSVAFPHAAAGIEQDRHDEVKPLTDINCVMNSIEQPLFSLSLTSPPQQRKLYGDRPDKILIPSPAGVAVENEVAEYDPPITQRIIDVPDSAATAEATTPAAPPRPERTKTASKKSGKRPATAAKFLAKLGLSHKVDTITQATTSTPSTPNESRGDAIPPKATRRANRARAAGSRQPSEDFVLNEDDDMEFEYPASDVEDDGYLAALDEGDETSCNATSTPHIPKIGAAPELNILKIGKLDLSQLGKKQVEGNSAVERGRLLGQSLSNSMMLQSFEITADGTFKRGDLAINASGLVWDSEVAATRGGGKLTGGGGGGGNGLHPRPPRAGLQPDRLASFPPKGKDLSQGFESDGSIVVSENDWVLGSQTNQSTLDTLGPERAKLTTLRAGGYGLSSPVAGDMSPQVYGEISASTGDNGSARSLADSTASLSTRMIKVSKLGQLRSATESFSVEGQGKKLAQKTMQANVLISPGDEPVDGASELGVAHQASHESKQLDLYEMASQSHPTKSGKSRSLASSESDLVVLNLLGRGSSATVYRAWSIPRRCLVAVKCVPIQERDKRQQLASELTAFRDLQSRHVTTLYGAYLKDNAEVRMVFEYMSGGSLQDLVDATGPLNEATCLYVLEEGLRGLAALQARGMVHRDIKPHNILLGRDASVKLADFGMLSRGSKVKTQTSSTSDTGEVVMQDEAPTEEEMCNTFVGTVLYMAPERVFLKPYGYASDIWALALSVLTCFLGDYPLPDNSDFSVMVHLEEEAKAGRQCHILDLPEVKAIYPQLGKDAYSTSNRICNGPILSQEFLSLLRSCLETEPKARPTVDQLLSSDILTHARLARQMEWTQTSTLSCNGTIGSAMANTASSTLSTSFASRPPLQFLKLITHLVESHGRVITSAQQAEIDQNPSTKRKFMQSLDVERAKAHSSDVAAAKQIVAVAKQQDLSAPEQQNISEAIAHELLLTPQEINSLWN